MTLNTSCSGERSESNQSSILEVTYNLERNYTGEMTNAVTIDVVNGANSRFEFNLASGTATSSISSDAYYSLSSQTVAFSYNTEGIYSADFKVRDVNGIPYIFEVLTWEYSTEVPDPPVISFSTPATKYTEATLNVSDSRAANTTEIWVSGDIVTTGQTLVDGGYWIDLDKDDSGVPIVLTPGDGVKTLQAKIKNIFGNISTDAVAAEVLLKQTPPTNCSAEALSTTIANNKLSVKLNATDPFQVNYSAVGSLGAAVSNKNFADDEVVFIYTSPTPGIKTVYIYVDDIAGNRCLEKKLTILLDPDFESEGLFVQNSTYWTDSENIVLDVFFDHFVAQEPLQLKLTGDIAGPNTNNYLPYAQGLPVALSPSTTGQRRIFAQYKDVDGVESYLITKSIFLKPGVTLTDIGGGQKSVVASNILGATTLTIVGCVETFTDVAWAAGYTCTPSAASIDVTWKFPSGSNLVKSAVP